MGKYGVNTVEIEAVIERVRNLTPAELKKIEDNWIHAETPEACFAREGAEQRAFRAIVKAENFEQWWHVLEALRAAYKESVAKGSSFSLWDTATEMCYAYFASEHISTRTFNILSKAWKEVLEGKESGDER